MFDWFAFADYSGAAEAAAQRKAIAWAVDRGDGKEISVVQGITRQGLLQEADGPGRRAGAAIGAAVRPRGMAASPAGGLGAGNKAGGKVKGEHLR
ncbi:hypothetical protein D3C75_485640 [compost metagenome]